MSAAADRPRRAYESPRRRRQAAETRRVILEAAIGLFGARGWAGTGMRDIARQADVSVETVYATFGSKTELLMAAVDVAVVGDDEPVPLSERPQFAALASGTRTERIAAAATLVTDIHARTAGVNLALREAASADPRLDALLRQREQNRRANVEEGVVLVTGRPADARTCDALWALFDGGVYRLLTDLRGWSPQEYREWIADTIDRLLD